MLPHHLQVDNALKILHMMLKPAEGLELNPIAEKLDSYGGVEVGKSMQILKDIYVCVHIAIFLLAENFCNCE